MALQYLLFFTSGGTIDRETGKPRQIRVEKEEENGLKVKKHYLKEPSTGQLIEAWSSIYDAESKTWIKAVYDKALSKYVKEITK